MTSRLQQRGETTNLATEVFRDAFRDFPAGVGIITAEGSDGPVAMTATSITSVSVDPPMLAFSVSDISSSSGALNAAESLVVHLLDSLDQPLAVLCSTSGSDRFGDESRWSRLESGEPFFIGARSILRAEVVSRVRAGNATVTVVRALDHADADRALLEDRRRESRSSQPLAYHNKTWHALTERSRIDR